MPGLTPTRRGAFAAAALLGGPGCGPSQKEQARGAAGGGASEWSLPGSFVLPLRSAANGVDYVLYVRPPAAHAAGQARYPVIVTLDADYAFPVAAAHLEHLAARGEQAPEAILVSVGVAGVYPDMHRYRMERSRDYTPVFHPDGGYGAAYQRASGGGPAFLRMLLEEALPLVASRWRCDPANQTLVGHSYGGLFTAWVLQNHPEAFNRYLMVSPSLWYADQMLLVRERQGGAARLARPTVAYLGVGSWEEQPGSHGPMVSQMTEFAALLEARNDPNLTVKSRVFEDETHASIFPACFSTGIRHLF